MRIGYRKPNDTHHSEAFFVVISRFETNQFPVRVRRLRLGRAQDAEMPAAVTSPERRETPRPGKLVPGLQGL